MGVVRRCTARMSARPPSSGKGTTTLRDKRPGLVRAGSSTCIPADMIVESVLASDEPHQARALPTILTSALASPGFYPGPVQCNSDPTLALKAGNL